MITRLELIGKGEGRKQASKTPSPGRDNLKSTEGVEIEVGHPVSRLWIVVTCVKTVSPSCVAEKEAARILRLPY